MLNLPRPKYRRHISAVGLQQRYRIGIDLHRLCRCAGCKSDLDLCRGVCIHLDALLQKSLEPRCRHLHVVDVGNEMVRGELSATVRYFAGRGAFRDVGYGDSRVWYNCARWIGHGAEDRSVNCLAERDWRKGQQAT